MSYPKYLMEKHLGRKLHRDEQVHHKDGNPLNNDLDNLEIELLGDHQKEHSTKYHDKMEVCFWCGKQFLWTAKQQSEFRGNQSKRNGSGNRSNSPFCSKKCVGEYGRHVQMSIDNASK